MFKSAARYAQHRANFAKGPRRRIKNAIPISVVLADKYKKRKRKRRVKRKIKVEEHVVDHSGPRSTNMEGIKVERKSKASKISI